MRAARQDTALATTNPALESTRGMPATPVTKCTPDTERRARWIPGRTLVGAKKPNPWGLYDMHGNVWEWCADWYDKSYYTNSPTDDRTGPIAGSGRVHRGGRWFDWAVSCRSAIRYGGTPGFHFDDMGFRACFLPVEK